MFEATEAAASTEVAASTETAASVVFTVVASAKST